MNRLAESAEEIYDYVKGNPSQIRFNTLGEGCFFVDIDYKLNKMWRENGVPVCREATNEEFNDLWRWLEKDMIQVEQKRGFEWIAIHQPKGKSFESN